MNLNSNWNPARIHTELVSWLNQPSQKQFMYEDSLRTIEKYLSGKSISSGELSVAMMQLSYWYSVQAAVGMFEGEASAIQFMYQSFLYEGYDVLLKIVRAEEQKRKSNFITRKLVGGNQVRFSFMDHGLILAKGIVLGCFNETEVLGRYTLSEFTKGSFYGLQSTAVTPFVLALFCQWKALPMPSSPELTIQKEFYQQVLENWNSSSPSDLEKPLMEACDFHIIQSQEDTDERTYEFSNPIFMIYPVEILAVFRLREELNVQVPNLEHPLMKTPLGKLYKREEPPKDAILEALKTEITQKMNI